jgi:hypothetical protein
MHFPPINFLAVLVAAIVIFALGGLWYSPVLFMKKWLALQNRTEEQMRAEAAAANMPVLYISAFVTSLLIALVMAHLSGISAAAVDPGEMHPSAAWRPVWRPCWPFAALTSYATAIFSGKPKQLWFIDSAYNLVSFVLAGADSRAWNSTIPFSKRVGVPVQPTDRTRSANEEMT